MHLSVSLMSASLAMSATFNICPHLAATAVINCKNFKESSIKKASTFRLLYITNPNQPKYTCLYFLSLLIKHQLRVGSACLIGANHNKIHVCKHAKTSVSAKLGFQLVA